MHKVSDNVTISKERPISYLHSFETPFLEWQSDILEEQQDDNLRIIVNPTFAFKCAIASEPFYPGQRYMFEVSLRKGQNFRIGICDGSSELAFSETLKTYAYYSCGQARHNSQAHVYGETFAAGDVVGCYVDLIEGKIFFSMNGTIYKDAFMGIDLLDKVFYATCACLTKDEAFEVMVPACED